MRGQSTVKCWWSEERRRVAGMAGLNSSSYIKMKARVHSYFGEFLGSITTTTTGILWLDGRLNLFGQHSVPCSYQQALWAALVWVEEAVEINSTESTISLIWIGRFMWWASHHEWAVVYGRHWMRIRRQSFFMEKLTVMTRQVECYYFFFFKKIKKRNKNYSHTFTVHLENLPGYTISEEPLFPNNQLLMT